jgi:hypothetical protein
MQRQVALLGAALLVAVVGLAFVSGAMAQEGAAGEAASAALGFGILAV